MRGSASRSQRLTVSGGVEGLPCLGGRKKKWGILMLDLIGAVGLTAGAAIVIAALAAGHAGTPAARRGLGAVLAVWFVLIVLLGAAGTFDRVRGIGTTGLGIAVVVPVLALAGAGLGSARVNAAIRAFPLALLIGVNAVRVLGVFFVLLYAAGRLPAPFAPVAGWGDILIGLTALPVARALVRQAPGWRSLALAWNALGLLDLVTAVGLGTTSDEGSPIRLFFREPGTAIMNGLPWLLIPAFLVPILMLTHLAVFYRLLASARPLAPARV